MRAHQFVKQTASVLAASAILLSGIAASKAQTGKFSPELQSIVEGARKEGVINIAWAESSFGGATGAKRFEAEINKIYGTKISIKFIPMAGFAKVGSRLATEHAAKQPAFSDVWLATAAQIVPILDRDLLMPVAWDELMPGRLPPDAAESNGRAIKVATGLSGADYNTQLAPMVPRTLDDFLRPEWKGKIATTAYAASFDVLAAKDVWGREKTLAYVNRLLPQVVGLMGCAESERIATGEYAALVMNCLGQFALQWKDKGAPIARMIPRDAAARRYYYLSVPRNSANINAAKLFVAYIMSPEGQKALWDVERLDYHALAGSQTAEEIGPLIREGVKFTDVTVDWVAQNPQVEKVKGEIIQLLRTKRK